MPSLIFAFTQVGTLLGFWINYVLARSMESTKLQYVYRSVSCSAFVDHSIQMANPCILATCACSSACSRNIFRARDTAMAAVERRKSHLP